MTARCPSCGGRGLIHWHPYWDNGNIPCPRCGGRGTIEEDEMTEKLKSIQFVFRSSDAPFSFCNAADYIDDQTAALHEHVDKHGFRGYARVGTIALNLDQVAAFWSSDAGPDGKPVMPGGEAGETRARAALKQIIEISAGPVRRIAEEGLA